MKHVGDITKLNGAELPVVNIITGGSPCQDLSVAGKRAGLAGERSGLFMEQIRLVKEMRENDRKERRSDAGTDEHIRLRTRYMVWENVPGAFSSNGGEDFRAVLEETAKVADKDAVIPRPPQKWESSGCILGDGWSIAWRTHDAQYWGVPQRRKRICMVADFDGDTAGKILFDVQLRGETEYNEYFQTFAGTGTESRPEVQPFGEGMPGDSEPSEQERKGTSRDIEKCSAASSYTLKIRGGVEVDSHGNKAGKGPLVQTELSATLGVSQDQTLITGCNEKYSEEEKKQIEDFIKAVNQDVKHQQDLIQSDLGVARTLAPGTHASGPHLTKTLITGCLNSWDVQSKHIQPEDGIAEALYSGECRGGGGESYVMQENVLMEAYQHHGYRESDNCGTLTAEQNQSIRGDTPLVVKEPILLESNQNHATIQTDGISTALPASMGMVGGYIPMVCSSDGDIAGTLDASYYKGCGMRQGVERTIVLNNQGGQQMEITNDVAIATMENDIYGIPNAVCFGIGAYNSEGMKSENPKAGIYESQTARTIDLNGGNPACNQGGVAVVQEADGYIESETMFNPNTVENHAVCVGNGQMCNITMKPIANGLDCMHDQQAVMTYGLDRAAYNQEKNAKFDFSIEEEKIGAQVAKGPGAVFHSVVRRLTPKECERLQGYPDHWTDIGEWVDSKGKKHKDADSPRYKALGNSIAVPFWQWMASRMVAYLKADGITEPTMASLFDGISGFCLCFKRVGCEPKFTSEIEEFPIAVCKRHFGDEETGEKGDINDFL